MPHFYGNTPLFIHTVRISLKKTSEAHLSSTVSNRHFFLHHDGPNYMTAEKPCRTDEELQTQCFLPFVSPSVFAHRLQITSSKLLAFLKAKLISFKKNCNMQCTWRSFQQTRKSSARIYL